MLGHGQCMVLAAFASFDAGCFCLQVSQSCTPSHQVTPCLPVICCAPLRPLLQVAHIMRAVVRFIAQCHAKGLIYRDIKPGGESLLLAGFL